LNEILEQIVTDWKFQRDPMKLALKEAEQPFCVEEVLGGQRELCEREEHV